jgi:hypothetical protein
MSPLARQFQKLVLDLLSEIELPPQTIVIVLNTLDEYGTMDERDAL